MGPWSTPESMRHGTASTDRSSRMASAAEGTTAGSTAHRQHTWPADFGSSAAMSQIKRPFAALVAGREMGEDYRNTDNIASGAEDA
ncbi:hypothetical protein CEP54_015537 [Fusarium duplospermum]|uniref:Uncharacterized protein n=1 Tax=Fusarium duplospermum TaxID=1325734 RepID=A0A428NNC1_9HYPO|nr:hypothetical protein CEP54_015537 [Fusarium duplospermum]